MKYLHSILIGAVLTTSLVASAGAKATQSSQNSQNSGEDRYAACIAMTTKSPDKAIDLALEWQTEDGGVPARHCEALGLIQLKEYAEAAARLIGLADDMRVGRGMPVRAGKRMAANAGLLADMYSQAANAWLLAGEVIRAEDAITLALSLVSGDSPQGRELLVDRARIAAADHDFGLALTDLETVLKADPNRTDILILIASAARGIGQYSRAEDALSAYRHSYPESSAALLELGNLRHAQGLPGDARKAWLELLRDFSDGPDADAARANLEKLDVHLEPEKKN